MINTLKLPALVLACSLSAAAAFAQSGKSYSENRVTKDETVVIKGKGTGRTVIELKDDKVYVNGDVVIELTDAGKSGPVRKKIIIEGDNTGGMHDFRGFNFDEDVPANGSRKAMLGVLTDPKSEKVGALIKDVTPGSAAEKAGLQKGDVITRIDGKAIKDAAALVSEISAQHEAGDKVTINYERDGKEQATSAKLMPARPQTAMRSFGFGPDDMNGDMPNGIFRSFPFMAGDDMAASPKLGVSAEDRADGDGVRVLSVKPGSPAASAGIKEGDVITRLDDGKVGSVDELQMNMRSMKAGDKIKLEYQRAGKTTTTDVTLPKTVKRKDL